MKTVQILLKYTLFAQLRSRWLLGYALFYGLAAYALLQFGADSGKAIALIQVVLLFSPAVAIFYATMHWYSAAAFHQLLLTQPVRRPQILWSTWVCLTVGLSVASAGGVVVAGLLTGAGALELTHVLLMATALHAVFTGFGVLCGVVATDRLRGMAAALFLWLYFALLHDGLVFLALTWSQQYAVDRAALIAMMANPLDLARLYLLLHFDAAALMGYTGALLERVAGSRWGLVFFLGGLAAWVTVPACLAARLFRRRDL